MSKIDLVDKKLQTTEDNPLQFESKLIQQIIQECKNSRSCGTDGIELMQSFLNQ